MLLERDEPLRILGELVAQLGLTGGKVVLVRGEAGIGKSALVRAFADARASDMHVYQGACDDLFIPQPLDPFWDIGRVEPSVHDALVDGDRPRLLEAVLALLSRRPRPTLIIFDDTQWADQATLDAIRYIGRRIARTNGMLLLTFRDGEVDHDHPLRGVIGDIPAQDVARIQLGGLSAKAVAEMVAGSGLDASDVMAATRGNPFLVREMAAAPDGGAWSSLQDSLMARVRKLSIGSQETLKTLSVIPEPIPREDALLLAGVDEARLDECEQRGLLDCEAQRVEFRHELIRRAVESSLTVSDRLARNRTALEGLPVETHACLLIQCALVADDIDRLLDLAPISARYNAATGSHVAATWDFRVLGPHLDRIDRQELGPLLDEWAREEFLTDGVAEAVRLNGLARAHYRSMGDRSAESRALAHAAHYFESAGQRQRAEQLAQEAIEVLGPDAAGPDLARALEANAYLQMMAGNGAAALELVDRTLAAGGADIEEVILIRSLNHRGVVADIATYPLGKASLDEARERAEAAGLWYEECRALLNHAWAAAEAQDLAIASDYAQRAIASALRHEQTSVEGYAKAMHARVLELMGRWDDATDLAREVLDGAPITQLVAMPILAVVEARRGRTTARAQLLRAWEVASAAAEFQRLAPAAAAIAEHAWITGSSDVPAGDLAQVMSAGLELGFTWSPGKIAFWLWKLGELSEAPAGIAEPYRLLIEGRACPGGDHLGVARGAL